LTRIRSLLALLVLALAIPAAVAGCGDDDDASSADPQTVLDETFDNDTTVNSGDLSLTASVSADGEQGGSFEASLSGPFQGDAESENEIPQLDWTASASGSGAGQSVDFSGGLVVTEDNAYVEYNDQAYEVGSDEFSQLRDQVEAQAEQAGGSDAQGTFQEQCASAIEQAGGDASGCDIDFAGWLTNLTNEGSEDVGGTPTDHIAGDANVEQILTDIGDLASSIPGAESQGFDPAQLQLLQGAVSDASIDVYSGTDDHVLRKLEVNLGIDPSAIGGSSVPISNITVGFAVEIDGLNEEQTIEAPTDTKPISDLLGDFGVDSDALGGALGATGGGGASGSNAGDAYLECVAEASTPAEINDCASQL
jgi:hypothetical protein